MAKPAYNRYQYETSPRKTEPEYKRKKISNNKKKNTPKLKQKVNNSNKLKKIIYIVFSFSILFAICHRHSQINESFARIQSLKEELSQIQKTNEQLNVGIQNSLNLNQVEQKAKELLGMQKLTNKQTIYVNLPKRDYVEPATEKVIVQVEEKGFFNEILSKVTHLFNKN